MENIIQPGIYDAIPFGDYRNFSATNKSLLDAFSLCPAEAKARLDDPESYNLQTEPMLIGSVVDTLVCEPEKFNARYVVRPETYTNSDGDEKPWNANAKVCREWITAQTVPVLSAKQFDEASLIARAVQQHPIAGPLLRDCKVQQTVLWTDPRTKLPCKGRPDFVAERYAVDLKVMRSVSDAALSKAIANFRYHVQAAFYTDGGAANGQSWDAFYFVCAKRVGDSIPLINVKRLSLAAIDLGRATYQRELAELAECMASGIWPDYTGKEIQQIDLPAYAYNDFGGLGPITIDGEEVEL